VDEHAVFFKPIVTGNERECNACTRACTQCRASIKDQQGRGRDNPMARDLIELARDDSFDWAALVSSDLLLIPAVRYVQSHGRRIIHGCFPPIAMDLTRECWASIDLSLPDRPPRMTSNLPVAGEGA